MKIKLFVTTLFFLVGAMNIVYGQTPGTLDTTFGPFNTGIISFAPPAIGTPNPPNHFGSVIQADGKIVTLLGENDNTNIIQNVLVRLNQNGTVDVTFGNNGYVYLTMGGTGAGRFSSIGKQIVAGEERFVVAGGVPCGRKTCVRVERYTNSGSSDLNFGTGGATIFSADGATEMAIQPLDQKIVMAHNSGVVMRLMANGVLDTGFGVSGIAKSITSMSIFGLMTLPSGRILVCGRVPAGTYNNFAVARLNNNGSLDDGRRNDSTPNDSFGNAGIAAVDFNGRNEEAYSITTDVYGKIVVSGQAQIGGDAIQNFDAVVVRFLESGQIDPSFGLQGKVSLDIGQGQDLFKDVSIQSDGKIVVTGEGRFPGQNADVLTARYYPNGLLDTTFGNGGLVMQDIYGAYDSGGAILLQLDPGCGGCPKIVVLGNGTVYMPNVIGKAFGVRYWL